MTQYVNLWQPQIKGIMKSEKVVYPDLLGHLSDYRQSSVALGQHQLFPWSSTYQTSLQKKKNATGTCQYLKVLLQYLER